MGQPTPCITDGVHTTAEPRIRVVCTADPNCLPVTDLDDLAAHAVEPNVFYEPWMLLPALRVFGEREPLRFVLLYADESAPVLCGFLPFVEKTRYSGLPIRALSLWRDDQCALCTPLFRSGYVNACLDAALRWASTGPSYGLIDWCLAGGDGPVHDALDQQIARRTWKYHITRHSRPLLLRRKDHASYLRDAMSSNHRNKLKRKERQLSDLGPVTYSESSTDSAEHWTEMFLRLEALGWKGDQGTAAACHPATATLFRSVVEGAQRRARLMLLSLCVNGVPIAMKCNLLAAPGAFATKIAYDPQYAVYSPGQLLEVENIRRFHELREIQWMDSCVHESFEHAYRWLDRRVIETVVVSTGGIWGNMVVTLLPWLVQLKRILSNVRPRVRRRP